MVDDTVDGSQEHFQAYFRRLEEALECEDVPVVRDITHDLYAADVARLIQYLVPALRARLIHILRPLDPEILIELDETVLEEVLVLLEPSEIATALSYLESDDAFSILEPLDYEHQKAILMCISPVDRVSLEEILRYPEDSAGRLMQREVVVVPSFWTAEQALYHLQSYDKLPESFYDIFVVNPRHQPIGVIPLGILLKAKKTDLLKDLMSEDPHTISVTTDQEQVALLFRRYSLVSCPVVDENNRIMGMITVDDVVNVIEKEASEDIMHLAGVTESDFYEPIFMTSFYRIQWLFVTLLNAILASSVVSQFQMVIEKKVALAVFMPIVAAMAGNSGMQVVTVTVRALATQELSAVNMWRTVLKETMVAFLNGLVFATVLGLFSALWFHDVPLGLVFGSSILFTIFWSGLAGTLLPLMTSQLKMDPALSAGPLVTATTDVLGFGIFLWLASLFLVQ